MADILPVIISSALLFIATVLGLIGLVSLRKAQSIESESNAVQTLTRTTNELSRNYGELLQIMFTHEEWDWKSVRFIDKLLIVLKEDFDTDLYAEHPGAPPSLRKLHEKQEILDQNRGTSS